jgi:hypothetical protein
MGIGIHDTLVRRGTGEFPLLEDIDLEGGFQVCTSSLSEVKYKKTGMYASYNGSLYRWSGTEWVVQGDQSSSMLQMVAGRQIVSVSEYSVIGVVRATVTEATQLTLKAICSTNSASASGSIRVYDVTNGVSVIGPVSITYNSGNYTYINSSDSSGETGTVFYELQLKLAEASTSYSVMCENATLSIGT